MKESDSISAIKGVGPKKAALLKTHLNIESVRDLLTYFPANYKNRGVFTPAEEWRDGCGVLTSGVFLKAARTLFLKGLTKTALHFKSDSGIDFDAIYYNQPYRANSLSEGVRYYLYGTARLDGKKPVLICPQAERAESGFYLEEGVYPVYPVAQKAPIRQRELYGFILSALQNTDFDADIMPQWIKKSAGLTGRADALRLTHMPKTAQDIRAGESYFKLCDFIKFHSRINAGPRERQSAAVIDGAKAEAFEKTLSFELTGAQKKAIAEISADLSSGRKMNRLMQGDVGSGKTAVAVCACYCAAGAGYQAAMTAPTEILARQHYEAYAPKLRQLGIESALLYSSLHKAQRRETLARIESGEARVIFGTHAVFSEDVKYRRLTLIVIDEQHRFGVSQRAKLEHKAEATHVLVMSATPIPRTLALSMYKDLDISILDEMPKNRTPVKTALADITKTPRIYRMARDNAARGFKTYIVCPAVDAADFENVEETLREAQRQLHPHKTAGLSGRTKPEEKARIMEAFEHGDVMTLIATSVVEVGVDVAAATLMWVRGSERFGLSQLHQLRGRVGRGSAPSVCIFQADRITEKVYERLTVLKNTSDGFEIARQDLKLRGSGELFGLRQSGRSGGVLEAAIDYEALFLKAAEITERLKSSDELSDQIFYQALLEEKDAFADIVFN